jgi:hypothetical protein
MQNSNHRRFIAITYIKTDISIHSPRERTDNKEKLTGLRRNQIELAKARDHIKLNLSTRLVVTVKRLYLKQRAIIKRNPYAAPMVSSTIFSVALIYTASNNIKSHKITSK